MNWLAFVRIILISELLRQTIREIFRRGRYIPIRKTIKSLSTNKSKNRMNSFDYYIAYQLIKFKDRLDSMYGGEGNYIIHPKDEFPVDLLDLPKVIDLEVNSSDTGDQIGCFMTENKKINKNIYGRGFVDIEVTKLINIESNVKKAINKRRSSRKSIKL